jgi:hypothetical protein
VNFEGTLGMKTFYILALLFGFSPVAQAQITEKPLKLEEQVKVNEKNDQIVFPPATEPYKPVPIAAAPEHVATQPASAMPQPTFQNQPVAQPQPYQQSQFQQPMMQPQPMMQQPSMGSVPFSGGYGSSSTTRDAIERAAQNCASELGELQRQKASVDPLRRAKFQKCLGEALVRCNKLKESVEQFKQADRYMINYQSYVNQAQETMR